MNNFLQTSKRQKTTRFTMPKAYSRDLETAIKSNSMSALEKARFVRYTASHFYAQQPNPTPTEYNTMAQQCVDICSSLADSPETPHKVVNAVIISPMLLCNILYIGQTFYQVFSEIQKYEKNCYSRQDDLQ